MKEIRIKSVGRNETSGEVCDRAGGYGIKDKPLLLYGCTFLEV